MKPVVIIGAGIGGLTTALVLKQANFPFVLFEAAPEIKAVGAGILLANNAMQVFQHLNIDQPIREKGFAVNHINITKADFSILSGVDLSKLQLAEGLQTHAIHRADLHEILANAVGSENIMLNKQLVAIDKENTSYKLSFVDGSSLETDYLIGADGIKSKVRDIVFGRGLYRDTQQICWRGVLNFQLPEPYLHQAIEAWGKGKRIGFVQINHEKVYWYLVINASLENPSSRLVDYTQEFQELAKELVRLTPSEAIIRNQLYDLKPISQWSNDRVCLLGDAAHATTPNMGQGACQAIEDAYVLARLIKKYSLEASFKKYPEVRKSKVHNIVNTSWRIGVISQLENPFAIALRNFGMKHLTSEKTTLKQMKKLFQLEEVH